MNEQTLNTIHLSNTLAKETAKKVAKMDKPIQPTRVVRINENTEVHTRKIHLTDAQVRAEFKKIHKRPDFYFDEMGQQRVR